MSGQIFINYRRGDEPGFTQALLGRLEQAFPPDRIFIDVDNISPGEDFVQVLESQVEQCDTLLAVIGKGWLDAMDERGSRRLDDPHDFVRIEIESALRHGKRVIPVLVHDARMPRADELPEALRPLARRNAIRLTHERFRADVQGLVKALQQALKEIDERQQKQAEEEAAQRAEAERSRQEAEAARRAEEEVRARIAAEQAQQRAAEERRLREAEAAQRAEAERSRQEADAARRAEEEKRARIAAEQAQQRAAEERRLREAEAAERAKEEQRRLEAEAEQRAQEQRRLREAETARRAEEEERRKKAEAEARQRAAEERRLREAESAERAKEEQRRLKAEAEQRAQEQRRLREAETARRAEEEERRKKAEAEARQRAAEERRREDAAAKQRAEAQQAFAAARRANTVAAIEAYQAAYPASHLAGEVQNLKAALLAREQAHRRVIVSDDPAVLRSFLATYKKGPDVNQARARLRVLEPQTSWYSTRQAIIVPSALAIILVGAGVGWLELRPRPSAQQPSVTAAVPAPPLVPEKTATTPPKAAPAPAAPAPAAPAPVAPAAPPAPRPDEAAWSLVKDTNDAAALQRFIEQYRDSPLREEADARIAALAEVAAWNRVKDSNDPDQLRKYIEQFPNSPERRDAEQRIASLAPAALKSTVAPAPDPHELARSLQVELQRVGCFNDTINGEFNDATKAALQRFIRLTSLSIPDDLSADAINSVRAITKRVCPLVCPGGKHANGDVCVPNPPPPAPPKPVAARHAPRPSPSQAAPAAAPRSAPTVTLGVQ